MSKSKSKVGKGATQPEADVLSKVKGAGIVKPSQTAKSKSKELAKQVALKQDKKKQVMKEKTPEPSESESESEESASSDSDEDEESEVEQTKPIQNSKVNGVAKMAAARPDPAEADNESEEDSEDESSDGDEDSGESDSDVPVTRAKKVGDSSEEEASESDEESEEEEDKPPQTKGPVKVPELSKKLDPIASDHGSDEESAEDSDDSDSSEDSEDSEGSRQESEDSQEDSSEEEADKVEIKPAPPVKRKAEDSFGDSAKKTKVAEAGNESQGNNLFVGNLSWNVDEEWLTREFEEFGELSGVRLITDRESGRSKGFGYVEFTNAADAAKAHAAKKGTEIDGRPVNVDFASNRNSGGQQDRSQARAKSFGDQTSPPSETLFVGNLSFDVGQETVSEAFSEYGTILGVRLPTDRETGEPKGFGYVTFASVDEAKAALEAMQGANIAGRNCRLDYSQPRPQNGDTRGGRGGGRGGFSNRGGRGGFGERGGRGGRGRGGFGGFGDRGGRGGRGGSTNRGGFGDFAGKKTTF